MALDQDIKLALAQAYAAGWADSREFPNHTPDVILGKIEDGQPRIEIRVASHTLVR